jgi:hypothetical protein
VVSVGVDEENSAADEFPSLGPHTHDISGAHVRHAVVAVEVGEAVSVDAHAADLFAMHADLDDPASESALRGE